MASFPAPGHCGSSTTAAKTWSKSGSSCRNRNRGGLAAVTGGRQSARPGDTAADHRPHAGSTGSPASARRPTLRTVFDQTICAMTTGFGEVQDAGGRRTLSRRMPPAPPATPRFSVAADLELTAASHRSSAPDPCQRRDARAASRPRRRCARGTWRSPAWRTTSRHRR